MHTLSLTAGRKGDASSGYTQVIEVLRSKLTILKSTIFWILYLGLAATSVIFTKRTILEYLESKTEYHSTKAPMTAVDIPTLTICFEHEDKRLKYGTHFEVAILDYFDNLRTLKEGENEIPITDLGEL